MNLPQTKPSKPPWYHVGAWALIVLIYGYRLFLSPFLGKQCRYLPTCSEYGLDAICIHGAVKGTWLILSRIARCHPWGGYGYDPVPPKNSRPKMVLPKKRPN